MTQNSRRKRDGRQSENKAPPSGLDLALLHASAGAVAGAVARFVVGPLDVLKIRFQVQLEPIAAGGIQSKYTSLRQALTTIVKDEGITALWRGTVPGQLLTIPYTAVQFVTLQQCKAIAEQITPPNEKPHASLSFISGALSGAAGTVASYPFDLLRTTLAAQGEPKVYQGMVEAAKDIMAKGGVVGLYRGLGVTLLEIIPYAALQFGLYDAFMVAADDYRCKHKMKDNRGPAQTFVCGLAAGTLAKIGTHPLDVAKKRFQVAGLARSAKYGRRISAEAVRSLPQCCKEILQKEGIAGFYKGALPSVIKAAPAAAVTFATYELMVRLLIKEDSHLAGHRSTRSHH